jgi:thioredoxin reductase (NADPH)
MSDIIIIGAGPAGLSAAINGKIRGKEIAVISNDQSESGLYKAERIDNYLGLPGLSGDTLINQITSHAKSMGIEITSGRVQNILPMGNEFGVGFGSDFVSANA